MKTITVTRKDLLGRYANNEDCPIARALKREFKTSYISVGPEAIRINGRSYDLPKIADVKAHLRSRSRYGFIKGGFTFELDI